MSQRKRRARSEQDKSLRRDAILEAAAGEWAESTFDALTMSDVARRARLAKGTLYLYFATKETLLLELLQERLGRWLDELESSLASGSVPRKPDGAARVVASMLCADEDLVRLLMILGSVLEQNVPEGRIRDFKSWLHGRLARTGTALERRLSFLDRWSGVKLLLHIQALVSGLGQLTRPAPVVARVLAAPEFESFRLDFETELGDALAALMHGASAAVAAKRLKRMSQGQKP